MTSPAVQVHQTRDQLGRAAADQIAAAITDAVSQRGVARVVFAAAPSQSETLAHLRALDLPWHQVEAFHMDEYVDLPEGAPQGFGRWLTERVFEHLPFSAVHLMQPHRDGASPDDYAAVLAQAPIDLVCFGIGVNGHLAFNDPPVADFDDPSTVKVVELDPGCRQQQVGDGCFESMDEVPHQAWTVTIPALLSARTLVGSVPGSAKARAVRDCLQGPLTTQCPASALRTHPRVSLHLDLESAALL